MRRPLLLLTTAVVAAGLVGACSSDPEPSAAALCEQLTLTEGLDESLAVADADALDEQAAALRRAVGVAPAEVEEAVRTLSETVDAIASTVSTAPGDRRTAITDTLAGRQDRIDALTWSGVAVAEWSLTNCGLDLETGTTVPTTTPSTTPPTDAPETGG